MDSPPMFNSVEDECRYWKERAKLYHKEWTDVKQEYDEYVEQSRQMEAEMDATLDQKQGIIKDLRMKVSSLEKENESLTLKFEMHTIEYANTEKQLENVKMERDSMKEYMRQLEQKNDDLERAHRILNESIVDFERMLDKAYEKNALLEMEVDEKEALQEKLQRLMDETRDLKQELNVKARYPSPANSSALNSLNSSAISNIPTLPNGICLASMISNNFGGGGDENTITSSTPTPPASATIASAAAAAANTNNIININNHGGSNNIAATAAANINDFNQHSSLKRKPFPDPDNLLNGNSAAMTASSRTTALNIVADMLRKLNAMETKLKTYRDHQQGAATATMQPRQ